MKVNREKVELKVKDYLKENFANKLMVEQIKTFMLEKGFTQGKVTRMINLNQYPEVWSDEHLGVMALAISELKGLSMEDYYNEPEIKEYQDYRTNSKKTNEDTMIFENAFQTTEYQFMIPIVPIQQLKEYWDDNLIGYDPEIQRELIRREGKNNKVIEKMNLNKRKMTEIAEKVITDKFFSNDIVINVLRNEEWREHVSYNAESKKLTIKVVEGMSIDIIDGAHRLMGFMKAIQMKNDVDFNTSINLSILDKVEAGRFIQQEDMHTPISKSKSKLLGNNNPFLEIAKKISKYGTKETNELVNCFAEDYNELKLNKSKIVTYETFAEAIKHNFFDGDAKITARKIDNVTDFLIKGFNEILGLLQDKFKTDKIEDIKQKGFYLENNIIIGYVALLSDIQELEDWKSSLSKTIEDINFTKEKEDEWRQLEVFSNRLNKSVIKKISEYFIERRIK